jgi:CheY-like chemotaxis protein
MKISKYNTVLLIDDNDVDNIITKKHLRDLDFAENIVIKSSAVKALDYLRMIEEKNIPEIIFLDIRMPEMDGFEFLEKYGCLDDKIKVKSKIIMLSSSLDHEDISKAMNDRYVFKFLNKPLEKDELRKISDLL